ncbi:calcium-binding protein [Sphingomonas sp. GCM10030256]|uniref:calcium-binding protein n=1 Tax=Sphingomonas sp. GCM10030256 TaxID=3273427 RepID=UPI00361D91A4
MAQFAGTKSYKAFDGTAYSLNVWTGRSVALQIPTQTAVTQAVMDKLLQAFDKGYNYYAQITGRTPQSSSYQFGTRDSIAVVDQTCGAGCGWLGANGIEVLPDYFGSNLQGQFPSVEGFYDAMAARNEVNSIVFYELGRNFWFYGDKLGGATSQTDWGFTTGYAVVNRYYAMQSTGFSINGIDAEYHNQKLPQVAATYFATAGVNGLNTLGARTGVNNPTGYNGSADLAAALFRTFRENVGPSDYTIFWRTLPSTPSATTAAGAFANFTDAARSASALDFSFLFKEGWNFKVGGPSDETLTAADHLGSAYAVLGFAGNDTLTGSAGAESLFGDVGADRLNGAGGDDQLAGGSGNDILDGGSGHDILHGGEGTDTMTGGSGNDLFVVGELGDKVIEASSAGVDTVRSSVTFTLPANVENVVLTGLGAINGNGNAAANSITGNEAANKLSGLGGDDQLFGLGGNDLLRGGPGRDTMTGGIGADRFMFSTGDFSGTTTSTSDSIVDFSRAQRDRIDLKAVDANATNGTSTNEAFRWVGSSAFQGTPGELRYEQISGNTFLFGDVDGDTVPDFCVQIIGLHSLISSDILL